MAQSDKIGRTALGLEPFWDKPSSNPPIPWEKWRSQLKMALVAKTNIELDELLQERPTAVIYPPEPVEEQPVQNPTQTMERERMTRYNQAVAKWKNECNHIDRIGVLCGDKPWDMADRKAKSLIYLSLGIEGRKMHARKFPHTNVEAKSTMDLWEELEQTFIRPRNVTFDRYLLLTRKQHRGETMEQFHSALRSLAEHCQLGYLEDALLRDIFTANMIDQEIQKELLKTTLAPEKALELAVSIELGIRSQLAIQARQPADVTSTPLIGREEPVMEISSSRYRGSNRPLSTYRGTTRGIGRASNNSNNRITTHNCRNCGQPWDVNHRSRCQAIGQTCRRCNKQNHFAKVCRSNLNRPQLGRSVNEIENQGLEQTTQGVNMTAPNPDTHSTYDDSTDDYSVNMMESPDDPTTPSKLHMQYGNSKFWVMVDSGSSTSIVTEQMAKDIEARDSNTWWSRTTNPMKLKSYTDTPIKNLGTLYCDIECNGWKAGRGDIIVVPNKHRAIVGRDLFKPLGIQLKQHDSPTSTGKNINSIDNPQPLTLKEEIATKYKNLTTRIGRSKHHKVKSLFKSNYTPVHQKGRRVPLHLETQVEEELRNLQNDGHITKLEKCSDEFFISPIVITVKKDKSIKLAMDSKTINKAIHKNKYQMHNIDCLMDNIAQTITQSSDEGEVLFSTIDLRYAYSQIPLDEDTAKQCNFNIIGGQATGTYRFNNGFYGLTDMPAEFQKAIDKTLYNLTNTFSFLDDIIIVTGGGLQNHKEKLFKCLDRLNEENLAINLNKCHFAKNKITWLGYEIDQKGIKPIVSKTQAILNLKPPTSNKQLKSFLGSVHHLTKFIPNLAPLSREFRNLLQKDTKYIWTNHHQTKFENIKECIRNLTENTHYDTKRKTRVKTDASRSGLGAVLEQETCDGWETISYASRFLNKAEEKYSINELELLGVVWALEHFKHYLLGHHFIVQTDHRALLSILKERSSKIHQSRLTRWYDRLIPFNFTIEHIAGTKMGLADYMSRNPSELAKPPSTYDENFIIAQIDVIKETLKILRKRGRPKKHNNNTITVKVPGQQDTVLNKSDIAKFGTPEQRKIPLINFAARKTVRNHHVKLIQNMESHAQDIKNKIIGQRAIRKRGPQASNSDRKAKANLTKVNRIRIPPKKTYQPSPKKGSLKKRKLSSASSQASADEQGAEPHDSDSSQDSNVTFKQHGNPFVIVTDKASTRRSARDKKKPKRYGELTELPSSDDSMDNRRTLRPHKGVSIASYSPPRSTPAATCTSPVHSVIPTIAPSPIDPNENSGIPSPDPNERQTQEDVLAIYNEDQPERSLQPHEY